MAVAIITGSGTHALPGLAVAEVVPVPTPFGTVELTRGELAGHDVLHISRIKEPLIFFASEYRALR